MHLIPVQNIRENNNNFSIIFHKPLELQNNNVEEAEQMIMVHSIVEKWIIDQPTQWFWQLNRFN